MRARVRENGRTMEHPQEQGQIESDYRIILPVEIEIPVIVMAADLRNVYQQIRTQFLTTQLLTVQTTVNVYDDMILAEMPHEESPDYFNTITIYLRFKQVQIASSTTTFAPADPQNTNTQNRGLQNPIPLTVAPPATSTAPFTGGGGGF